MFSQRGLTLVELLVALLVFSFVAAACIYALRLGVEARDQLAASEARLSRHQIARSILKDDLAQIVDRPVRDEFGDLAKSSFRAGVFMPQAQAGREIVLMSFVRGGWINSEDKAPRSELQYVEYLLRDGAIFRRTRPYLDDARGQQKSERLIISDASGAEFEFLSGEANGRLLWSRDWPAAMEDAPPRAVALSFTSPRWGDVRELFWIGALGPEPAAAS